MLRHLFIIGVGVACLMGGATANQSDQNIYSAGDAAYEGLIELGRQSTVYSFNFNNLIIIIILKLIIIAVLGGLGFGLGAAARSLDEEESSWVDGSDMLFMLTYLVSDGIERYDCLNRLACLDDSKAQDLLFASRMMIKGAKYLQPFFGYSVDKYERISNGVQDAIDHKRDGGSCHLHYQCHAMPSL